MAKYTTTEAKILLDALYDYMLKIESAADPNNFEINPTEEQIEEEIKVNDLLHSIYHIWVKLSRDAGVKNKVISVEQD